MYKAYFESSIDYEAAITQWCDKFNALMKTEMHAAVAILGYYLPWPCNMLGCPLGDSEFEKLGTEMRDNPAAFAAAEKTGLIAEAISAIFDDALDNCDSWAYHRDNIGYILKNDFLCKFVSFSNRHMAECLFSGGELLADNEDTWELVYTFTSDKLSNRSSRGYA